MAKEKVHVSEYIFKIYSEEEKNEEKILYTFWNTLEFLPCGENAKLFHEV